jgi:hypothetical protein
MGINIGATPVTSLSLGATPITEVWFHGERVFPTPTTGYTDYGGYDGTPQEEFLAGTGDTWWYGSKQSGTNPMPPFGGSSGIPFPHTNDSFVTLGDGDYTGYANSGTFYTYARGFPEPEGVYQPTGPFSYVLSDNVSKNAAQTYGGGTYNSWAQGNVSFSLVVEPTAIARIPFILLNTPGYNDFKDDLAQWIKDQIVQIILTGEELPGMSLAQQALVRPALFLENSNTPMAPIYTVSKGDLMGYQLTDADLLLYFPAWYAATAGGTIDPEAP